MRKWIWFGIRVVVYPFVSIVITLIVWSNITNFFFMVGKVMFWLTIIDLIIMSNIKDFRNIISCVRKLVSKKTTNK